MLCLLSGLHPLGGPSRLIDHEDLDIVSTTMASEILSYGQVSFSLEDLTSIVSSALELTLPPPEYRDIYDFSPKLPDGISDGIYFDCVAIGHFDEDGECPSDIHDCCYSGRDIEVRHIDHYDYNGRFYGIVVDDPDAEDGSRVRIIDGLTYCKIRETPINFNFFVMRRCLEYLRAWLDPSLPPRVAFLDSTPSMSLEGELYEIVNSRHETRDDSCLIPSIQYGDITKTSEPDYEQLRFMNARKGSQHTSHAINTGLRGNKLLPAIYRDFQCWLSMRLDVWPSPTASSTPTFIRFPASNSHPFNILPTELLLDIFRQLPIDSLLSLSSASRSLRALITEPAFLNQTIKAAVLGGSAFWVLPVTIVADEEKNARCIAMEWLTMVSSDNDVLTTESPFHSPSFPYLAFLHACYESDSMRNRKRLWNIVKQFDGLWRDYRLHGWQRDVFIV